MRRVRKGSIAPIDLLDQEDGDEHLACFLAHEVDDYSVPFLVRNQRGPSNHSIRHTDQRHAVFLLAGPTSALVG
jgi:hypothetical protein